MSRTWKANEFTGVRARRMDFFLLPDFAFTAHMIQGATLEAALCSPQGASENTTTQDQIAAYVAFSRARQCHWVWALRDFSPWLFQGGAP